MGGDFIIGCVGKPSAGKSTFFNAATEGSTAKVGSYPFTTITPNEGIGYYITDCPCKKYGVGCSPRYGRCVSGRRSVPIRLLDVAGLIPGASEGRGLGCKFLDDLRVADVLLHIIDGEATTGYDPSADHEWLLSEVELWIFKNIWGKWTSVARRHAATNSSLLDTFSAQFSGYGAPQTLVAAVLQELHRSRRSRSQALQEAAAPAAAAAAAAGVSAGAAVARATDDASLLPEDLTKWASEDVMELVKTFVKIRFPFVLVLNKCDAGGDVDKNVLRLSSKFRDSPLVLTSALAECFLQKLQQQKMIAYDPCSGTAYCSEDLRGPGSSRLKEEQQQLIKTLKPIDPKAFHRLEKVRDLMLFRHGGTGVAEALRVAVEVLGQRMAVYPVKTLQLSAVDKKGRGPFVECMLVKKGTTVGELAHLLHPAIARNFLFAELPDGRRVGENEVLTPESSIIRINTDKGAQ
ncbi:GTP-binding protein, putative [Eimeria necatrix]|uniref:GTP-binding protein, putative n=1 Tax=Eimeria necatrix TaxID=51315 RepID=U6MKV3_9EIME|nr:GTP-binding protein, putative [Eimeria necatrix]CDJ64882.1 GTP-binding protein, putative [Eimeria necatrix]